MPGKTKMARAPGAIQGDTLSLDARWERCAKCSWNAGVAELGAGWVQDSWPRLLADACPRVELPAGMPVNEKQTAPRIAEMARQDPAAPVRNAPGSGLTAPGRTGLVETNWGPTTTREEILAFMQAQIGNVMLSPRGNGYVYTEGWDADGEVWALDEAGRIADIGSLHIGGARTGQDWIVTKALGLFGKV